MHKFIVFLLITTYSIAQQPLIKGSVLESVTLAPIENVKLTLKNTTHNTFTNIKGEFYFNQNIPLGPHFLIVTKQGYITKRYPIVVNQNETVDLSEITLTHDTTNQEEVFTIALSEDDLNTDDEGFTDNISGLLQASKNVFLTAAAYDFSTTFFRPRGLNSNHSKMLINGIEMNKQFNGRPQWSNWGGLNDALRNQDFTHGFGANAYSFGDIAGTTNLILRASKNRKGGRISYASANRSYQGRFMASYNSGILKNGWAYSVLASRRYGNQGYIDGTLYDANSFFTSVEKQINQNHHINFAGIYATNKRGRSTAITDEVFYLKGNRYNPLWGYQNGKKRNTRVRNINEPIIMLNHFWQITPKINLNTNAMYQFGTIGNTRVDNGGTQLYIDQNGTEVFLGGARNQDPTHFQNLPSFFLQDQNPTASDFRNAFIAQRYFKQNGQFNFNTLYAANALQNQNNKNATFVIQEDINQDNVLVINTLINAKLNNKLQLNGGLNYKATHSQNYAQINDLLGGRGFLDIDSFFDDSENTIVGNVAQSDLQNRNRIVTKGERYKYNYIFNAAVFNGFAQLQYKNQKISGALAAHISNTNYQRKGLYENGNYPAQLSLGKSKRLNFYNYGARLNMLYQFNGRHSVGLNSGYFTKAPTLRNSFSNPRQNNTIVTNLQSQNTTNLDLNYIYRSPIIKSTLSLYGISFTNDTDVSFYFTEDLAGLGADGNAFVQEITTNVNRLNIGVELGVEAQITSTLKLKAIAAVGQNTYANNPNIYLTSDDFTNELRFGNGKTNLKNLHVAGGPEQAFQLGFEYRDPKYWTIGLSANHFSNAYIDASALARSENFTLDFDGLPFNSFNKTQANNLLKQEQLPSYMLINLVGGKSWRIGKYYVGFFATINNVLNQLYKTGGFEQSRIAKFDRLLEDQSRENGPLFGNRYFFGNGTTYYCNLYVRF